MPNFDPAELKRKFEKLSKEDVEEIIHRDQEINRMQVARFKDAYSKGMCYLCGEKFETINKNKPCSHWLLRRGKFKKSDFTLVYKRYDYHNMAAFLRWCANEEVFLRNINDLENEKRHYKVLSSTIKWKDVEWTFDCSNSDYKGHKGKQANFPHYHFQMRIDGRAFIKFSDYHIPFSERDLMNLALRNESWFHGDFGYTGSGMQDAVSLDLDAIINSTENANEDVAQYKFSTIIESLEKPITGEELEAIIAESKRTNKSFASLAKKYFANRANVSTIVSVVSSLWV